MPSARTSQPSSAALSNSAVIAAGVTNGVARSTSSRVRPVRYGLGAILYLAVASLDPTGKGRARWSNRWKAAPNAFDIAFDGRISAAHH